MMKQSQNLSAPVKAWTRPSAAVTLFLFLVTQIFFSDFSTMAFADGVSPQSGPVSKNNILEISLPENLGTVQEIHRGTSGRTVVIVQDAHSIPDAQKSIHRLIAYFSEELGLQQVGLEGASSLLDTRFLKYSPDPGLLKKTLKHYLMQGELSGGTAAAIFSDVPGMTFKGIENWTLYEEGIRLYRKAVSNAAVIETLLHEHGHNLTLKKKEIYSDALLDLDQSLTDFEEHKTDLAQLLKSIARVRRPLEGSDLSALLSEINRNEMEVSAAQAVVRRAAGQIEEGMHSVSLSSQERALWNQNKQAFETGKMTPEAFALFMTEWLEKYPQAEAASEELHSHMKRFAAQHRKLRNIEGSALWTQLEVYAKSAKESLFTGTADRNLDRENRLFHLTRKMARLELSAEEWHEVRAISFSDAGFEAGTARRLEELFVPHRGFYENAEARDQHFVDSVDHSPMLLVLGGFHAHGITRGLKEKGISYVLIMPSVPRLPDHVAYKDQMQGNVSWRNYFEPRNGKVDLYEAFMRSVRDRLLENAAHPGSLLKAWRDELIRGLADEGRIENVSEYTRFIDEKVKGRPQVPDSKNLQELDRFIEGLRDLRDRGELTQANILNLFKPQAAIPVAAGPAMVSHDSASTDILSISKRPVQVNAAMAASEVRQVPEVSDVPAASEPAQVSLRAVEQALEEAAGELAERILPAQDVSRTAEWLAERTSLSPPEQDWLETLFIAAFTLIEIISAGVLAALVGYILELLGVRVSPSGMFRGTVLLASGFVGYVMAALYVPRSVLSAWSDRHGVSLYLDGDLKQKVLEKDGQTLGYLFHEWVHQLENTGQIKNDYAASSVQWLKYYESEDVSAEDFVRLIQARQEPAGMRGMLRRFWWGETSVSSARNFRDGYLAMKTYLESGREQTDFRRLYGASQIRLSDLQGYHGVQAVLSLGLLWENYHSSIRLGGMAAALRDMKGPDEAWAFLRFFVQGDNLAAAVLRMEKQERLVRSEVRAAPYQDLQTESTALKTFMRDGFLDETPRMARLKLALGLFTGISLYAVNGASFHIIDSLAAGEQQSQPLAFSLFPWLVVTLFMPAVTYVEELVFRGILFERLKRVLDFAAANTIQALLFALVHSPKIFFSFGTAPAYVIAERFGSMFVAGFILGAVAQKWGRSVSYLGHVTHNLLWAFSTIPALAGLFFPFLPLIALAEAYLWANLKDIPEIQSGIYRGERRSEMRRLTSPESRRLVVRGVAGLLGTALFTGVLAPRGFGYVLPAAAGFFVGSVLGFLLTPKSEEEKRSEHFEFLRQFMQRTPEPMQQRTPSKEEERHIRWLREMIRQPREVPPPKPLSKKEQQYLEFLGDHIRYVSGVQELDPSIRFFIGYAQAEQAIFESVRRRSSLTRAWADDIRRTFQNWLAPLDDSQRQNDMAVTLFEYPQDTLVLLNRPAGGREKGVREFVTEVRRLTEYGLEPLPLYTQDQRFFADEARFPDTSLRFIENGENRAFLVVSAPVSEESSRISVFQLGEDELSDPVLILTSLSGIDVRNYDYAGAGKSQQPYTADSTALKFRDKQNIETAVSFDSLAAKRSEVRAQDGRLVYSNGLPFPAAEGTRAERLLEAFKLASFDRVSRQANIGELEVYRVQTPDAIPAFEPPQGIHLLRAHLGPVREFELLYNAQNQLIAIFPVVSRETAEVSYFDFSDYYPAVPGLGAEDALEKWKSYLDQRNKLRRAIDQYKETRGPSYRSMPRKWNSGAQEPFVVVSVPSAAANPSPEIFHFRPEQLISGEPEDRRRARQLKSVLAAAPGQKRLLYMLYPTVYSPGSEIHARQDAEYNGAVIDAARKYLTQSGQVDWDDATGSGIGALLKYWMTEKVAIRRLASDINALAAANARDLAALAGFRLETAVHDTALGLFPFDDVNSVQLATSNSGAFSTVTNKPQGPETFFRSTKLWWDNDIGGAYLKGLSRLLEEKLDAGGMAVTWNVIPSFDKMSDKPILPQIEASLGRDGLDVRVSYDGSDGDGESTLTIFVQRRSEVRNLTRRQLLANVLAGTTAFLGLPRMSRGQEPGLDDSEEVVRTEVSAPLGNLGVQPEPGTFKLTRAQIFQRERSALLDAQFVRGDDEEATLAGLLESGRPLLIYQGDFDDASIGLLNELVRRWAPEGVQVLARTDESDLNRLDQMIRQNDIRVPVIYDPDNLLRNLLGRQAEPFKGDGALGPARREIPRLPWLAPPVERIPSVRPESRQPVMRVPEDLRWLMLVRQNTGLSGFVKTSKEPILNDKDYGELRTALNVFRRQKGVLPFELNKEPLRTQLEELTSFIKDDPYLRDAAANRLIEIGEPALGPLLNFITERTWNWEEVNLALITAADVAAQIVKKMRNELPEDRRQEASRLIEQAFSMQYFRISPSGEDFPRYMSQRFHLAMTLLDIDPWLGVQAFERMTRVDAFPEARWRPYVYPSIAGMLSMIYEYSSDEQAAKTARNALESHARDNDPAVSGAARNILNAAARRESGQLSAYNETVARALTAVQDSRLTEQERVNAVRILGAEHPHYRSVRPLIRILNNRWESPMLRRAAAWALGNIGSSEAGFALRRIVENYSEAYPNYYRDIHPEGEDFLSVRTEAVTALGRFREPALYRNLVETLTKDKIVRIQDPEFQAARQKSLDEITRAAAAARVPVRSEVRSEPFVLTEEEADRFADDLTELYFLLDNASEASPIRVSHDLIAHVIQQLVRGRETGEVKEPIASADLERSGLPPEISGSEDLLEWMNFMRQTHGRTLQELEVHREPDYSDLVFAPETGDAVLILGPSMSGKSSLATALQTFEYSLGGESDTGYLMLHIPGFYLMAGSGAKLDTIRARAWSDEAELDQRRVPVSKFDSKIGLVKAVITLQHPGIYKPGRMLSAREPRISSQWIKDLSDIPTFAGMGVTGSQVLSIQVTHGYTDSTGYIRLARTLDSLMRNEIDAKRSEVRSGENEALRTLSLREAFRGSAFYDIRQVSKGLFGFSEDEWRELSGIQRKNYEDHQMRARGYELILEELAYRYELSAGSEDDAALNNYLLLLTDDYLFPNLELAVEDDSEEPADETFEERVRPVLKARLEAVPGLMEDFDEILELLEMKQTVEAQGLGETGVVTSLKVDDGPEREGLWVPTNLDYGAPWLRAVASALQAFRQGRSEVRGTRSERPLQQPVPAAYENEALPDDTRSYIDRHQAQWDWIKQNVIESIFEKAEVRPLLDGQKPQIRILDFGSASGEEPARLFYEVMQALIDTGRNPADWDLKIQGIEFLPEMVNLARRGMEGRRPFYGAARESSDYADRVIAFLNQHLPKFRESVSFQQGDIHALQAIKSQAPEADLIFVNHLLRIRENLASETAAALQEAWPEAVIGLGDRSVVLDKAGLEKLDALSMVLESETPGNINETRYAFVLSDAIADPLTVRSEVRTNGIFEWSNRTVLEGISPESVRQGLQDVRTDLYEIRDALMEKGWDYLDLEEWMPEISFSDRVISQYVDAVGEFNKVILNGPMNAEKLKAYFLKFHSELGKASLIQNAGSILHQDDEDKIDRIFDYLFSERFAHRLYGDPLGAAAQIYTQLVNIQGFADGNKRASSFILNYILMKAGYEPFVLNADNAAEFFHIVMPIRESGKVRRKEFAAFLEDWVSVRSEVRGLAGRFAGRREFLRAGVAGIAAAFTGYSLLSRPADKAIKEPPQSSLEFLTNPDGAPNAAEWFSGFTDPDDRALLRLLLSSSASLNMEGQPVLSPGARLLSEKEVGELSSEDRRLSNVQNLFRFDNENNRTLFDALLVRQFVSGVLAELFAAYSVKAVRQNGRWVLQKADVQHRNVVIAAARAIDRRLQRDAIHRPSERLENLLNEFFDAQSTSQQEAVITRMNDDVFSDKGTYLFLSLQSRELDEENRQALALPRVFQANHAFDLKSISVRDPNPAKDRRARMTLILSSNYVESADGWDSTGGFSGRLSRVGIIKDFAVRRHSNSILKNSAGLKLPRDARLLPATREAFEKAAAKLEIPLLAGKSLAATQEYYYQKYLKMTMAHETEHAASSYYGYTEARVIRNLEEAAAWLAALGALGNQPSTGDVLLGLNKLIQNALDLSGQDRYKTSIQLAIQALYFAVREHQGKGIPEDVVRVGGEVWNKDLNKRFETMARWTDELTGYAAVHPEIFPKLATQEAYEILTDGFRSAVTVDANEKLWNSYESLIRGYVVEDIDRVAAAVEETKFSANEPLPESELRLVRIALLSGSAQSILGTDYFYEQALKRLFSEGVSQVESRRYASRTFDLDDLSELLKTKTKSELVAWMRSVRRAIDPLSGQTYPVKLVPLTASRSEVRAASGGSSNAHVYSAEGRAVITEAAMEIILFMQGAGREAIRQGQVSEEQRASANMILQDYRFGSIERYMDQVRSQLLRAAGFAFISAAALFLLVGIKVSWEASLQWTGISLFAGLLLVNFPWPKTFRYRMDEWKTFLRNLFGKIRPGGVYLAGKNEIYFSDQAVLDHEAEPGRTRNRLRLLTTHEMAHALLDVYDSPFYLTLATTLELWLNRVSLDEKDLKRLVVYPEYGDGAELARNYFDAALTSEADDKLKLEFLRRIPRHDGNAPENYQGGYFIYDFIEGARKAAEEKIGAARAEEGAELLLRALIQNQESFYRASRLLKEWVKEPAAKSEVRSSVSEVPYAAPLTFLQKEEHLGSKVNKFNLSPAAFDKEIWIKAGSYYYRLQADLNRGNVLFQRYQLDQVTPAGRERTIAFDESYTVGRIGGDRVQYGLATDMKLSARHFTVKVSVQGWQTVFELKDHKSTNGTHIYWSDPDIVQQQGYAEVRPQIIRDLKTKMNRLGLQSMIASHPDIMPGDTADGFNPLDARLQERVLIAMSAVYGRPYALEEYLADRNLAYLITSFMGYAEEEGPVVYAPEAGRASEAPDFGILQSLLRTDFTRYITTRKVSLSYEEFQVSVREELGAFIEGLEFKQLERHVYQASFEFNDIYREVLFYDRLDSLKSLPAAVENGFHVLEMPKWPAIPEAGLFGQGRHKGIDAAVSALKPNAGFILSDGEDQVLRVTEPEPQLAGMQSMEQLAFYADFKTSFVYVSSLNYLLSMSKTRQNQTSREGMRRMPMLFAHTRTLPVPDFDGFVAYQNQEQGIRSQQMRLQDAVRQYTAAVWGHGVEDRSLSTARRILQSGELRHLKGDTQYSRLGLQEGQMARDAHGTGLVIRSGAFSRGERIVSFDDDRVYGIVFAAEYVPAMRREFPHYAHKIFSYAEAAEKFSQRSEVRSSPEDKPAPQAVQESAAHESWLKSILKKIHGFWKFLYLEYREEGGFLWFLMRRAPQKGFVPVQELYLWKKMMTIRREVRRLFPNHPYDYGFKELFNSTVHFDTLDRYLELGKTIVNQHKVSPRLMFKFGLPAYLKNTVVQPDHVHLTFDPRTYPDRKALLATLPETFARLDRELETLHGTHVRRFYHSLPFINVQPFLQMAQSMNKTLQLESREINFRITNPVLNLFRVTLETQGVEPLSFLMEVQEFGTIALQLPRDNPHRLLSDRRVQRFIAEVASTTYSAGDLHLQTNIEDKAALLQFALELKLNIDRKKTGLTPVIDGSETLLEIKEKLWTILQIPQSQKGVFWEPHELLSGDVISDNNHWKLHNYFGVDHELTFIGSPKDKNLVFMLSTRQLNARYMLHDIRTAFSYYAHMSSLDLGGSYRSMTVSDMREELAHEIGGLIGKTPEFLQATQNLSRQYVPSEMIAAVRDIYAQFTERAIQDVQERLRLFGEENDHFFAAEPGDDSKTAERNRKNAETLETIEASFLDARFLIGTELGEEFDAPTPITLNSLEKKINKMFRGSNTVETKVPSTLWDKSVVVILSPLLKVLFNLIKNADEATRALQEKIDDPEYKPKITVEFNLESDDRFSIEIRDNGPGISDLKKAQSGISFTEGKVDGTGVGLPASKKRVEQMDGIWEVSTRRADDGTGWTKFKITLPVEARSEVRASSRFPWQPGMDVTISLNSGNLTSAFYGNAGNDAKRLETARNYLQTVFNEWGASGIRNLAGKKTAVSLSAHPGFTIQFLKQGSHAAFSIVDESGVNVLGGEVENIFRSEVRDMRQFIQESLLALPQPLKAVDVGAGLTRTEAGIRPRTDFIQEITSRFSEAVFSERMAFDITGLARMDETGSVEFYVREAGDPKAALTDSLKPFAGKEAPLLAGQFQLVTVTGSNPKEMATLYPAVFQAADPQGSLIIYRENHIDSFERVTDARRSFAERAVEQGFEVREFMQYDESVLPWTQYSEGDDRFGLPVLVAFKKPAENAKSEVRRNEVLQELSRQVFSEIQSGGNVSARSAEELARLPAADMDNVISILENLRDSVQRPQNTRADYAVRAAAFMDHVIQFITALKTSHPEGAVIGLAIPEGLDTMAAKTAAGQHARALSEVQGLLDQLIVIGRLPGQFQTTLQQAGLSGRRLGVEANARNVRLPDGQARIPVVEIGESLERVSVPPEVLRVLLGEEGYQGDETLDYYTAAAAIALQYAYSVYAALKLKKGMEPADISAELLRELDFQALNLFDTSGGKVRIMITVVQSLVAEFQARSEIRKSA